VVSADLYHMTGYTNALKEIARNLAFIGEEVLLLDSYYCPYTMRIPLFRRRIVMLGKAKILSKHFSLKVAWLALPNLWSGVRRNRKYLTGSKKLRLNGLLNYVYTKQYAIQLIKAYEPSIVHIHGFTLELLPFYDAVLELEVPFVATAHGIYSFDPKVDLWFDRTIEKDLFTSITNKGYPITTVSSRVKDQAVQGFRIPEESIQVVLNGVDVDKFRVVNSEEQIKLRDKYRIPPGMTILLAVGSIQKRKNQIAVLEALSELNETKRHNLLYLVVGGGDPGSLHEFIAAHSLHENVRIVGRVSDEVLRDYYSLADLFILTSTSEGFPLVFLEAMAMGLPIVTYSDLEAANEIYDDESMVLAVSRDSKSLAASILEATEKQWDRNGIRLRAESWSWKKVCEQYLRVYQIAIAVGNKTR